MDGLSLKNEDETSLFSNKARGRPRGRNIEKAWGEENKSRPKRWHNRGSSSRGAQQRRNQLSWHNNRQQNEEYYNCGKKGHYAKDYWSKKKPIKGNAVTWSKPKDGDNNEPKWDVQASLVFINYEEYPTEAAGSTAELGDDILEMENSVINLVAQDTDVASKPDVVDYDKNWFFDFGCFNYMIGGKQKVQNLSVYRTTKGSDSK